MHVCVCVPACAPPALTKAPLGLPLRLGPSRPSVHASSLVSLQSRVPTPPVWAASQLPAVDSQLSGGPAWRSSWVLEHLCPSGQDLTHWPSAPPPLLSAASGPARAGSPVTPFLAPPGSLSCCCPLTWRDWHSWPCASSRRDLTVARESFHPGWLLGASRMEPGSMRHRDSLPWFPPSPAAPPQAPAGSPPRSPSLSPGKRAVPPTLVTSAAASLPPSTCRAGAQESPGVPALRPPSAAELS